MFGKLANATILALKNNCRRLSTASLKENIKKSSRTRVWQIHSYGDLSELQAGSIRIPIIQDPNEVLIQVEAASVNPIDILMMGGYGRTLIQIPRRCEMELPLTLGRDFSGTILQKGHAIGDRFKNGDKVYGFLPLHEQGAFSETIVANQANILRRPKHLNAGESASLVYATMTAWSALFLFGNLSTKNCLGARVLVLGASGGVGTAAVQLLKSQGCEVIGTCSTDAAPLVQSIGANHVFDYKDPDYVANVAKQGFYHIILDCAKFGYDNVPTTWKFDQFITLNSPLLLNTDQHGLVPGILASASTLLMANLRPPGEGRRLKWGFFVPSNDGFKFIDDLIQKQKINPHVHKEFAFEELPEAFKEVQKGHLRGKVIVNV